ncbi:hypothetical protein [Hymenobacter sp. HDW8]|uniref:hypothetical protein n=1 Tax=Hymenobacter sp. HDW8 TaxID=2714932 RepID=UPI001409BFA0|nr:hypothetical protein [Hymenobacter sp. HDW8]QIL76784.1 hypothetical protein G7064_13635 [Hymenobacter sp. HDW8]
MIGIIQELLDAERLFYVFFSLAKEGFEEGEEAIFSPLGFGVFIRKRSCEYNASSPRWAGARLFYTATA